MFSAILLTGFATVLPVPAQSAKPGAAEPALLERSDYRQAVEALRDKLPGVAAARLKKILASGTGKGAAAVRLLLAEALVRSGSASEGLAAASAPDSRDLPGAAYWRGAALALLGRYAGAEQELAALPADSRYAVEAAFTRASVLTALGRPEEALTLLGGLSGSGDRETAQRARLWRAELMLASGRPVAEIEALAGPPGGGRQEAPGRYLRARLALVSGRAKEAAAGFAALAEGGRGIAPPLQHAAALGQARALQEDGQKAEALALLEKLIGLTPAPQPAILMAAFDAFERLNVPPSPEAESFLRIWAQSGNADLRIPARLAAAAAQEAAGRPADALAACQALAAELTGGPLLPLVLLRGARLSLAAGDREAVRAVTERLEPLAAAPAVRAWTLWLKAAAGFDAAEFAAAAKDFSLAAAESTTREAQAAAAYNAAVAEMRAGIYNPQGPLALLDGVDTPGARTAGAEFHLERALYLAAAGKPGAGEGLTAFVAALPGHPRRFEALAALAEIAISATPPSPEQIRRSIDEAAAAATDPASRETAAWLKVLAAEKTAPPGDYAREGAAFLEAWPESVRRAPLRMRLGEMYFRRQNFAGARQQFEQLAAGDPLHPLAEAALFWAGKSALLTLGQRSGDDAIALWEQVYKRGGALKLEARLQVALLKQRRNDAAGALELLDDIMATDPAPDAGTRRQVFCARGEILVAQNASRDAVVRGLASFDQVAGDAQMPQTWRQEALVRKGVCLEQLKRPDEALDAWHTVLSGPPGGENPDDYWFHRAGEKALRLLESRGKFEEAVTIAEKMARAPGPRGRAAAELVNQLALKYGIWREIKP